MIATSLLMLGLYQVRTRRSIGCRVVDKFLRSQANVIYSKPAALRFCAIDDDLDRHPSQRDQIAGEGGVDYDRCFDIAVHQQVFDFFH
jgi:hypothetical protein